MTKEDDLNINRIVLKGLLGGIGNGVAVTGNRYSHYQCTWMELITDLFSDQPTRCIKDQISNAESTSTINYENVQWYILLHVI